MYIYHTTAFKKMYKKLDRSVRAKADERLSLFAADPFHPILENHPLTDVWAGCRSINVTGDFRIVYRGRGKDIVSLEAIGTHHQLYGS
jgi:addiction module RelE/StbE family toxin